ncbi:NADP-dependent oxidoreductase [Microbacterium deminutum]|uniref:Enoyl reductase (ER) domain-containing protein n=1 Tax=Microbacterium deminutum TaxID=344164 RepID=A0ABN2RK52_9MICO
MNLRENPEFRLHAFQRGYLSPLIQRPELAALSRHPLDAVRWVDDWSAIRPSHSLIDTEIASSLYGRLVAEAVQWIGLGRQIGAFPASISEDLAWAGGLAHLDASLPGGNQWLGDLRGSQRPTELEGDEWNVSRFNEAMWAAIEDANPNRLEFVRIALMASDEERRLRLTELKAVETLVADLAGAQLPTPLIDEVSWALSGQDSAIAGDLSPSYWRSNSAIRRSGVADDVIRSTFNLASAVLAAHTGAPLPRNVLADIMMDDLDGATLINSVQNLSGASDFLERTREHYPELRRVQSRVDARPIALAEIDLAFADITQRLAGTEPFQRQPQRALNDRRAASNDPRSTMKAFALTAADTLPTYSEIDAPEPEHGEVRVRVLAASVNGFDVAVGLGYLTPYFEYRYPVVLGREFSGVVDALGDGVEGLAIGDRVLGVVSKPYLGEGAFAEYTTADVETGVVLAPDALTDSAAASLAHTGSTAVAILRSLGPEPAGKTLLVVGATGGVGTLLVQLASAAGVDVIATGRTEEGRELLEELGARWTVDYSELEDAVAALAPEGVDAAAHLSGDPAVVASLVKDGGVFASPLVYDPAQLPGSERLTFTPIAARPNGEDLRYLTALAEAGELRVIVDRDLRFDDVATAFAEYGSHTLGNIVILIGSESPAAGGVRGSNPQ